MEATSSTDDARRWPRWLAVAIVVVVAAPVVAAGVAGALRSWVPAGDWAVLELRTRDVGTAATSLIGPYSRYGWNHPGPLLFWVFALPYRLAGASSSALLLAAAVVNAVAVAAVGVLAWRRGRLPLVLLTAAGVAVLLAQLGPSFLRDPWNPSVTVLPFGVLVLLAWSAWEGERWALPVAAFVASFLVQSHVGFALLVVALGAWAVLGAVRAGCWARPVAAAAAVLALCWAPVAVDQVAGTGNAGSVASWFLAGDDAPPVGLGTGLGVTARQLGGLGPWVGSAEVTSPVDGSVEPASLALLLVPLAAAGLAALAAWRTGQRSALRFQATVAVAAVVGVVSVSRISEAAYTYLVRWWWVLALLWWVSALWSAWCSARAWWGRGFERRALATVGALGVLVAVACSARTLDGIGRVGTPDGDWYVTLDQLGPETVAAVPDEGPVVVRGTGSVNGSVADGVRLQLERAGVDVVVDDEHLHKYGEARRVEPEPAAVVWVVTGWSIRELAADPDLTEVARWDPLDADQRAAQDAAEAQLTAELEALGRGDLVEAMATGGTLDPARDEPQVDQDLLGQVEAGRRQGDPVAVFLEGPAA